VQQVFGIRSERLYQPSKPVRDPLYKRFIKRLPCCACGKSWNVDPAHTGPHGTSQKSSDLSCIPLCRKCHDAFDAAPRDFAELKRLDVPALIAKLNQFWFEKLNRGAA
jgi:hypothetical protein